MSKNTSMKVDGKDINIYNFNNEDYICLTDMAKSQDETLVISKWISQKNTIEFLGAWESMNNPDFNYTEFGLIRNESGGNNYVLSVKRWIEATNGIGLIAKTGRYGGTYAHKDIAFEFGTWISPTFKLYLIKEFQRLKEQENNSQNLEWNMRRMLSKAHYTVQTDAIKDFRIPNEKIAKDKEWIAYAEEGDVLNIALFGFTAKQWKEANPELLLKGHNARDFASINELAVLSTLEGINAEMIKSNQPVSYRVARLRQIAQEQLQSLSKLSLENTYKRTVDGTFQNLIDKPAEKKNEPLSDFNQKLNQALQFNPKGKEK